MHGFRPPGCKKCQQHTPVVTDGGGRWGGGQNADGHTWVSIRRRLFAHHRARQRSHSAASEELEYTDTHMFIHKWRQQPQSDLRGSWSQLSLSCCGEQQQHRELFRELTALTKPLTFIRITCFDSATSPGNICFYELLKIPRSPVQSTPSISDAGGRLQDFWCLRSSTGASRMTQSKLDYISRDTCF